MHSEEKLSQVMLEHAESGVIDWTTRGWSKDDFLEQRLKWITDPKARAAELKADPQRYAQSMEDALNACKEGLKWVQQADKDDSTLKNIVAGLKKNDGTRGGESLVCLGRRQGREGGWLGRWGALPITDEHAFFDMNNK